MDLLWRREKRECGTKLSDERGDGVSFGPGMMSCSQVRCQRVNQGMAFFFCVRVILGVSMDGLT